MTGVLRGEGGHVKTDTRRMAHDNEGRDEWCSCKPRNAKECQGGARGRSVLSYRVQRAHGPVDNLMWDFQPLEL